MFNQRRNRKKKSLTDPVAIIPYAGQSIRGAVNTAKPKASIPSERIIPSFKKEVKTLSVPTGAIQTNNLSIKKLLEKKEQASENQAESTEGKPQNRFTLDELKMYWRQFAFKLKEEGSTSIYTGLTKVDPNMPEDYKIVHVFDNQPLLDMMTDRKMELVGFLREKLKNWSLEVEFVLNKLEHEQATELTSRDKFKRMTDKNASLLSLQKVFGLDLEM